MEPKFKATSEHKINHATFLCPLLTLFCLSLCLQSKLILDRINCAANANTTLVVHHKCFMHSRIKFRSKIPSPSSLSLSFSQAQIVLHISYKRQPRVAPSNLCITDYHRELTPPGGSTKHHISRSLQSRSTRWNDFLSNVM